MHHAAWRITHAVVWERGDDDDWQTSAIGLEGA
jgi:hypothetical protein